tara:strand:- start:348 stop:470 length:123 start_codon:yes stop_codon:yes gene_type:complete
MERVREWIYKLNSMDSILLNRIEVLERKIEEIERRSKNED